MSATPHITLRPIDLAGVPRADWDRLVTATAAATPFARWAFHRAWWDAYGDTAHEQYLAATDEHGTLRALVPLMHRHALAAADLADHTVLRAHGHEGTALPDDVKAIFFGASYHADYATILADSADLEAVSRALADALHSTTDAGGGPEPWDAIDLRRLRTTDPALTSLEGAFRSVADAWTVIREIEDVCPVVNVVGHDWDSYLAMLDKKDRHEIRRKLRRAAVIGDLSIEISAPSHEAVEAFIGLHRARFGELGLFPDTPGGDRSRRFVHRLAELERDEPDGGQLHVGLVRCGQRLIFAVLAFDDGSTCFLYNAGMDPAALDASPGISGTALYLQDRIAAGRGRFDFLRGDEPYKYQWGAHDEAVERILVLRSAAR